MKKIRMVLLAVVVVSAVSAAFAAKKKFDCFNEVQFYFDAPMNEYKLAGVWGVDYYCANAENDCTYILTGINVWEPCRRGNYIPVLPAKNSEKKP